MIPHMVDFVTEINVKNLLQQATPHEVQTLPQEEVVQLVRARIAQKREVDTSAEREAIALKAMNVTRDRNTFPKHNTRYRVAYLQLGR